jgi:hypothetical protein
LLEKFKDHPDCERIVAREMGWESLDETLQAQDDGESDDPEEDDSEDDELASADEIGIEPLETDPPEPDPAREGIDWVRDKDGDVVHPIEKRASDALYALLDETKASHLLNECDDADFNDFVGHFMTVSAKLAGALGGIARGWRREAEAGFTIALLKRILEILNKALAAAEATAAKPLLSPERMAFYRAELFGVREDVIAVIARLRE